MNQKNHLSSLLIFYWLMFWLMNGLDKFYNRQSFSLFTWYGNDRNPKFTMYFDRIALSEEWVNPVLYLVGVLEIAIAIFLAISLWFYKTNFSKDKKLDKKWFKIGMLWGGATFVGFTIIDVILGDRLELLEHSTYLILICVTYQLVLNNVDTLFGINSDNKTI